MKNVKKNMVLTTFHFEPCFQRVLTARHPQGAVTLYLTFHWTDETDPEHSNKWTIGKRELIYQMIGNLPGTPCSNMKQYPTCKYQSTSRSPFRSSVHVCAELWAVQLYSWFMMWSCGCGWASVLIVSCSQTQLHMSTTSIFTYVTLNCCTLIQIDIGSIMLNR